MRTYYDRWQESVAREQELTASLALARQTEREAAKREGNATVMLKTLQAERDQAQAERNDAMEKASYKAYYRIRSAALKRLSELTAERDKARAEVAACDGHGYLRDQIKVLEEKLAAMRPALDAKDRYIQALEKRRYELKKELYLRGYGGGVNAHDPELESARAELRREKALRQRAEERLEILKRSVRACEETLIIETAPPTGYVDFHMARAHREGITREEAKRRNYAAGYGLDQL